MNTEDKVALTRKRAEAVESLAAPISVDTRERIQGELRVINAKIKAINTTTAAQLKAEADRRKVAGLAEAHANAARARANAGLRPSESTAAEEDSSAEDDDPGQTSAIDSWIDAVLLRHDVTFTRTRAGKLAIVGSPEWAPVIGVLVNGIYAAARGQELPDLPAAPPKASKAKPKKR